VYKAETYNLYCDKIMKRVANAFTSSDDSIKSNDCIRKGIRGIERYLFLPRIIRLRAVPLDPTGVSNLKVQSARNRDRQCRCFTRCSTSMTIASNFVRSLCVLSRLPPPPPLPHNPFSFTSPFIPRAFLYLAVPGRSIQFAGFRICKRRKSV